MLRRGGEGEMVVEEVVGRQFLYMRLYLCTIALWTLYFR
jgi:hypothetical protein